MSTRTTRVALSRESILRAALHIADREGLDALSMRRVGEALGVEAMSLYNHVASKAAMLDGLFEIVLAELPPARRAASWTAALRERARALRGVLRAHPNALPLFSTRPAVTPGALAHLEAGLEVLRTAGFPASDALSAFQVLLAFVVGHTVSTHAPRVLEGDLPRYDQLGEAEFPRIHELGRLLADADVEQEFELGLEAMLVGLEARLGSKRRSRPR